MKNVHIDTDFLLPVEFWIFDNETVKASFKSAFKNGSHVESQHSTLSQRRFLSCGSAIKLYSAK